MSGKLKTAAECLGLFHEGVILPYRMLFRKFANPDKTIAQLSEEISKEIGEIYLPQRVSFWCGTAVSVAFTAVVSFAPALLVGREMAVKDAPNTSAQKATHGSAQLPGDKPPLELSKP